MKDFKEFLSHLLTNFNQEFFNQILEDELQFMTQAFSNDALIKEAQKWFADLKSEVSNRKKNCHRTLKDLKQIKSKLQKFELATDIILDSSSEEEILDKVFFERGKILIETQNYKEAYDDFWLANGANGENDPGTIYRLAFCAFKLQNKDLLSKHLNELESILENCEKKNEKMSNISHEFEKLQEKLKNLNLNEKGEGAQGLKYVHFQKNVQIRKNEDFGRFMTTKEEISVGDKIFKEKAFAFVPIHLDGFFHDCAKCASTNIVTFPCSKCKLVYCSLECLQKDEAIHQFVCQGIHQRFLPMIGLGFLALQTFLEGYSSSTYNEILNSVIQSPEEDEENQYRLILSLQTHYEKMPFEDRFSFGLTAFLITLFLKENTEFPFIKIKPEEVATLILKHICQMVTNAHIINDIRCTYNGYPLATFTYTDCFKEIHKDTDNVRIFNQQIFSAIFPVVSLLNHSCKPNIQNHFNQGELQILGKSLIEEGGEIFNNYGLHHLLIDTETRKSVLREQYHFECLCQSCQDDEFSLINTFNCSCGKVLKFHPIEEAKYKIENCSSKCSTDHQEFKKKLAQTIVEPTNFIESCKLLDYFIAKVHRHNPVLYEYMKRVWEISDKANTALAERLIETTKFLYGEKSLETFLVEFEVVRNQEGHKMDLKGFENVVSERSFRNLQTIFSKHFQINQ